MMPWPRSQFLFGPRVRRCFLLGAGLCAIALLICVMERMLSVALADVLLVGLGAASAMWILDEWVYEPSFRTLRVALAASEVRCLALAEQPGDVVLRVRSDRRRIGVSPAIEPVLGYLVAEARMLSLRGVIHPEDLPRVKTIYNALSNDSPRASTTFRVRHKNGSFIWTEAQLHRTAGANGVVETAIRLQNVTERHLEAETLRLATETAQAAQAGANEANKAKTEFLARMSHEIRTPLNAVIGFTSLLLDLPALPPQARHYSERIKAAGHALLSIVNDILDFAQVESGVVTVKPKAFALPLLVDECLSIVQEAATAKHLVLDVHVADPLPAGVLGDEARLRQILLNLLNNAIKFTNEGSVRLDIRYDRAAGAADRLTFSVIDTGIGIAAADQADLFQRFRQVDGTIRRTYGGTGLGLAISKQLVELMGGTIGVSSAAGSGSTFWFSLDLPAASLLLQADKKPHYAPKTALSLLLVEDVVINQELVCLILEAGGHKVDVVCNGAEAIMAAEHTLYDAVLMDIQMPYMDGLTATRAIRALPGAQGAVPVIAMTANVLPEQTRLAKEAGMDEVIHKPFTAPEIYDVLDQITERAAARRASADAALLDRAVLLKLAGLIGEPKVKALLGTMAQSIVARFDGEGETSGGRAALRRDAHASIAGAGMLGFTLFSLRCQALESAQEDETFAAVLKALRSDAAAVITLARSLSSATTPLAEAA